MNIQTVSNNMTQKKGADKPLFYWLVCTALSIAFIVAMGGATRLTHSGLSIVEWKPILGIIPPLSTEDWMIEFEKYKQFPEFALVHSHFTLNDFKSIYWMEFLHRLAGRLGGIIFAVPLLYFIWKKRLPGWLIKRSALILFIGMAQGLMGWYMVKSGLVKEPAVSHFRLAAHLLLALLIFSIVVGNIFKLKTESSSPNLSTNVSHYGKFLNFLYALLMLLIITITYGAFVAGLKAGLIYNTYPLMEGQLIASEWNFLNPLWENFVNNPATVQFIHRWLAFLTLVGCWYAGFKLYALSKTSKHFKHAAFYLMLAATIQFLLGVMTLVLNVPVWLGTLHQVHVLVLLTAVLYGIFQAKHS